MVLGLTVRGTMLLEGGTMASVMDSVLLLMMLKSVLWCLGLARVVTVYFPSSLLAPPTPPVLSGPMVETMKVNTGALLSIIDALLSVF